MKKICFIIEIWVGVPLTDKQVKNIEYYKPSENSEEIKYLKDKRIKLGGFIPERSSFAKAIKTPPKDIFEPFMKSTGSKEIYNYGFGKNANSSFTR